MHTQEEVIAIRQKFQKGDVVHVAKNLGPGMSHFQSDMDAIVLYSYRDRYGRPSSMESGRQEYCLLLADGNQLSWYHEEQLTFLGHAKESQIERLLRIYEDED